MNKFASLKTVLGNKFKLIRTNPKVIKGLADSSLILVLLAGSNNK